MEEYKKMYLTLIKASEDSLALLEEALCASNNSCRHAAEKAHRLLSDAEVECERIFIEK